MDNTFINKPVKKSSKSTSRRILNIIVNVIFALLLVLVGIIIVLAIQSKVAGTTPTIEGFQLYKVLSGSMEPNIQTGSIIIIKQTHVERLSVGDIITFKSREYNNELVTHRIVKINKGNSLSFTTRGDANDSDDTQVVNPADIKGKAVISVPYIGYFMDFAQSTIGCFVLIIIPGILIILYEIRQITRYSKELYRKKHLSVTAIAEENQTTSLSGEGGKSESNI